MSRSSIGSFKAGVGAPVVLTYQTRGSSVSDLALYTLAALAIGAASADRIVVVGITLATSTSGFPRSITGVTIGGIAATQIAHVLGTQWMTAAIFAAVVPSGTTATVEITLNGNAGRIACDVWTMTEASITPADTATDSNASSDPSVSIDIPAGGACIACAGSAAVTTTSWSGLTEDADAALEAFTTHTAASDTFVAAQTGKSVSANFAFNDDNAMAVASFG